MALTRDELNNPDYNPQRFINWLLYEVFDVSSDKELAIQLGFHPSFISEIRRRKTPASPTFLVRVSIKTGLPVGEIIKKMYQQPKNQHKGET